MKNSRTEFIKNNIFRMIRLAFMLPMAVFVYIRTAVNLATNTEDLVNYPVLGIFITFLWLLLTTVPIVITAAMLFGSAEKPYIGYTKAEIGFQIFITVVWLLAYAFFTPFYWFIFG